jgi:hypothetical protein
MSKQIDRYGEYEWTDHVKTYALTTYAGLPEGVGLAVHWLARRTRGQERSRHKTAEKETEWSLRKRPTSFS